MKIDVAQIIFCFLLVINIIGLFMMKNDKRRAMKKQTRISERSLWLVAICGGAIGMFGGMFRYRHKSKHLAFKVGLPALIIGQFLFISLVCTL